MDDLWRESDFSGEISEIEETKWKWISQEEEEPWQLFLNPETVNGG